MKTSERIVFFSLWSLEHHFVMIFVALDKNLTELRTLRRCEQDNFLLSLAPLQWEESDLLKSIDNLRLYILSELLPVTGSFLGVQQVP